MCGIAGIGTVSGLSEADRGALPEMIGVLDHRGPDGAGRYVDQYAGLGHARLSIIDLAGGLQPMGNEDGTVWVTFNGEIYNFTALRDELAGEGHCFKTRSDTEVLVHLYERDGLGMFEKLEGMFAFGIWDSVQRRMVLARDRLGIKPLYYSADDERVVFGSELKAILAAGVGREMRADALMDYLCYLYVPSPKTIFRDVWKLEAGTAMVWEGGKTRQLRYWDVPTDGVFAGDEGDAVEALDEHLHRAVKDRLVSDVPLGSFLSGGLDSSAVVATMAGIAGSGIDTCSIGFEESAYNELEQASMVAERFETQHHTSIVTPDAVSVMDALAWHYDEPFADSSSVPTYYVSREARKHVTVALSGDGGDENFGGYRRYRFAGAEQAVRGRLPGWLRGSVVRAMAAAYPKADWLPKWMRAKSTLGNLAVDGDRAYFRSVTQLESAGAQRLLADDVGRELRGYDSFSVMAEHFERCGLKDPASRAMYVDLKTYLTDDILCKVDRASMANSLEVRVPLLDHRMVEFAASLGIGLKIRDGGGKWVLKELMRPALTGEIVDRRKQGFCVPVAEWLRGPLRSMSEDLLLSRDSAASGWLNGDAVAGLWRAHQSGRRDNSAVLWALVALERWAERFMGSGCEVKAGRDVEIVDVVQEGVAV